jgi:hypothetical protein
VAALADDGNWLARARTYLIVGLCEGPADVLVRRWDVEADPDAGRKQLDRSNMSHLVSTSSGC